MNNKYIFLSETLNAIHTIKVKKIVKKSGEKPKKYFKKKEVIISPKEQLQELKFKRHRFFDPVKRAAKMKIKAQQLRTKQIRPVSAPKPSTII